MKDMIKVQTIGSQTIGTDMITAGIHGTAYNDTAKVFTLDVSKLDGKDYLL